MTWTCVSSSGSTCTGSGSGSLLDTGIIAAGGWLSYRLSGVLSSSAGAATLVNTAEVTLPAGVSDPDTTNNGATWTTVVTAGLSFYTVTPCRLVDTRGPDAPILTQGEERTFTVVGRCGVPATAKALALNVTVAGPTAAGNMQLWPGGTERPSTPIINFGAGQTQANNAVVAVGPSGAVNAVLSPAGQAHLIVDVSGYFE